MFNDNSGLGNIQSDVGTKIPPLVDAKDELGRKIEKLQVSIEKLNTTISKKDFKK